tara:strand:- start:78 stop:194 length:117 start_codon:yes stop_codon:yes gene_type:complete
MSDKELEEVREAERDYLGVFYNIAGVFFVQFCTYYAMR